MSRTTLNASDSPAPAEVSQAERADRLAALERQLARLERRLHTLHAQSDALTARRALVFLGGLAAVFVAASVDNALAFVIGLVWVVIFAALVRAHRRVKAGIARHTTWRDLRRAHLARMRIDWLGLPESSAAAPPDHPFATDLDIVGPYSLHRLLDTGVSRGGSRRLLGWLLATTPDHAAIEARRDRVRALAPLITFRDKLAASALLSGHRGQWDGGRLLAWLAETRVERIPRAVVIGMSALAALNIALIVAEAGGLLVGAWRLTLVAYILLSLFFLRRMGDAFGDALRLKSELEALTAVLRFLETYHPPAHNTALRDLLNPFRADATRPTAHLRRLNLILGAHSLKGNVLFWMFVNLVVPWDIVFTAQLDRSKGDLGRLIPRWLDAWYELEALNSLAAFAWMNPAYTFPALTPDAPAFVAAQIGHPLIPHEARVCNDFALGGPGEVVIVTGSNMSGKSSFLRTVGVNLALAYAGGVVAAESLSMGLFRPYTCIKVSDSVVDGISYFYAEVRRLRALLEALRDPAAPEPLLFLIDEIFRGTNNRERLIGSRAFIRALVGGRGCGLISTHDLELAHLAESLPGARNLHFREDVIDGRMAFDYALRDGPSPTTNALRIMALEGLPVDEAGEPV